MRECLRAFREVDDQLKAAQASLKPYIEVLNGLGEASVKKEHWGIEAASHSRQHPHYDQTNLIPQSTQSSFGEYISVPFFLLFQFVLTNINKMADHVVYFKTFIRLVT